MARPGTRSQSASQDAPTGTKRKATPPPSRSKKQSKIEDGFEKQQNDNEADYPNGNEDSGELNDKDMAEATESDGKPDKDKKSEGESNDTKATGPDGEPDKVTKPESESNDEAEDGAKTKSESNGTHQTDAVQSTSRTQPRDVLEKGIIYFFTRARVGLDQATSVDDLARSYIVLRPIPKDAKLTSGSIQDLKNCRLLALPKKVLPRSGKDRFMTFVEKVRAPVAELKDFMSGSQYETQTLGTRSSPPVTPVGEGVYALTSTGRESHLAYMLTIPAQLGEVQDDFGLANQGSFVLSTKNPEQKGPANAQLPEGPGYPKDIMDAFSGRRWMPLAPEHLDFVNAQVLLIGEGELKAGEDAAAELEKLEEEDEARVKGLSSDDTVFADLKISKADYPSVQTTW